MTSTRIIFGLLIALYVAFAAYVFKLNLPEWCAHPERPGNHLVQPLCK